MLFRSMRTELDNALEKVRVSNLDLGKCGLTRELNSRLAKDPKLFDSNRDDFEGTSFPYAVMAGNLRLLEEERAILLELKGVLAGAKGKIDDPVVVAFVGRAYPRLQEQIASLRARTLLGYEFTFRVPLGPLETYNSREIGFKTTDTAPNFFWILERRAYYVNQARVAAGKLFEMSVNNLVAAESIQDRFLHLLYEVKRNSP